MKKREILIDLTSLLDVVLILMFFILVQSTGNLTNIKEELREELQITENQLASARQERDAANKKLEEQSNWDNERTKFERELNDLNDWRTAVEEAIFCVSIEMQTNVEPHTINISAKPNVNNSIDVIWADGDSNVITNENDVLSKLNAILASIVDTDDTNKRPVLIMLSYDKVPNKEFNLIDKGIEMFRAERISKTIYYSEYEYDSE
jgi:biopolymer transport protein ExbD